MSHTQLKKLLIENFRALHNVEIAFGNHVTVICGKNGTAKSSILGIAAQIFSFEKDYVNDELLSFEQITGGAYKSLYSDHFRISDKFDKPGSMKVSIELLDGYTECSASAQLELSSRGKQPRPVVRNNSTAESGRNRSRNFTHPVIFLSLKRLYPIAARDYRVKSFDYLKSHEKEFVVLTNELLNRSASMVTGTDGTIGSAVAHAENYDQESVSAGEDNAGQIVLALMSFRKLKEEYSRYQGGLLLIDEADAGLFPTAQISLLDMLNRECGNLNLQVIMTSHSPVLIEHAHQASRKFPRNWRTVYLSNTYGNVQVMNDWSWTQINADLNTKTVEAGPGLSLPKVRVYFEDAEAVNFGLNLIHRQPFKRFAAVMSKIALGASNYLELARKGIPEFSESSLICLDSDQKTAIKKKPFKTVVLLPGHLPPDQLLFEHLYNLPKNHAFWRNQKTFTREVFTLKARDVISTFEITGDKVDLKAVVERYAGTRKPRELFKQFYKDLADERLFSPIDADYNPWKHWTTSNPMLVNEFLERFTGVMRRVMSEGYKVDVVSLSALKARPRKG